MSEEIKRAALPEHCANPECGHDKGLHREFGGKLLCAERRCNCDKYIAPNAVESRSMLRRQAIMNGEPAPDFSRAAEGDGGPRKCKYGDPTCPCQDGDPCHYEGENPMSPPNLRDKATREELLWAMDMKTAALKRIHRKCNELLDDDYLDDAAILLIKNIRYISGAHYPAMEPTVNDRLTIVALDNKQPTTPRAPEETKITIDEVFRTNISRCLRWHPGGIEEWSALEWAGAMCGEAGEAANAAKKLKRVESKLQNINAAGRSLIDVHAAKSAVAEEVADTILYGLLLMARVGVESPEEVIAAVFNRKSEEYGFPERLSTHSPRAGTEK